MTHRENNPWKFPWGLAIFNFAYVIAFGAYFVSQKSYEFILYLGVVLFFVTLVLATLHRSRLHTGILWGLSLWGMLHLAGGALRFHGKVLYDQMLLPLIQQGEIQILKYDQAVHAYGFGLTTWIGYVLLRPYFNERTNWKVVYPILVAIGMGMGALNEVIEFVAVLLSPETGVGGYTNTALDLVFNMAGALIAIGLIHFQRMSAQDK